MRSSSSANAAQTDFAHLLFSPVPEREAEQGEPSACPASPPLPLAANETGADAHTGEEHSETAWSLASATLPVVPIVRVQLVRERDLPLLARLQVAHPEDAARIFRDYLQDPDREVFAVLMLDTKNRFIGLNTVSIGTLDSALVSPREVFKAALLANAASLILAHNHPSGDPTPSEEDKVVTRRLQEAGRILQIDVLDHLVIGEGETFTSLKLLGAF